MENEFVYDNIEFADCSFLKYGSMMLATSLQRHLSLAQINHHELFPLVLPSLTLLHSFRYALENTAALCLLHISSFTCGTTGNSDTHS